MCDCVGERERERDRCVRIQMEMLHRGYITSIIVLTCALMLHFACVFEGTHTDVDYYALRNLLIYSIVNKYGVYCQREVGCNGCSLNDQMLSNQATAVCIGFACDDKKLKYSDQT